MMRSQMMGVMQPFPGLMQPMANMQSGLPMSLNMMAGMSQGFLPQMQTQVAAAGGVASQQILQVRELIRSVYERRNPAKLGELGALFAKYAGSEMDVYRHVCQKYGETPQMPTAPQELTVATENSASAAPGTGAETASLPSNVAIAQVGEVSATNGSQAKSAAAAVQEIDMLDNDDEKFKAKRDEEEEFKGGWPFRGEPYTDNEDSDGPMPPEWLIKVPLKRPLAPRARPLPPTTVVAADPDSDSSSSSTPAGAAKTPAPTPATVAIAAAPGIAKAGSDSASSSSSAHAAKSPAATTAGPKAPPVAAGAAPQVEKSKGGEDSSSESSSADVPSKPPSALLHETRAVTSTSLPSPTAPSSGAAAAPASEAHTVASTKSERGRHDEEDDAARKLMRRIQAISSISDAPVAAKAEATQTSATEDKDLQDMYSKVFQKKSAEGALDEDRALEDKFSALFSASASTATARLEAEVDALEGEMDGFAPAGDDGSTTQGSGDEGA